MMEVKTLIDTIRFIDSHPEDSEHKVNLLNALMRELASISENAPQDVLDSLSKENDQTIKRNIANNIKTSEKTLQELYNYSVRDRIIEAMYTQASKNVKIYQEVCKGGTFPKRK